jgi:hypothetical protein
MTPRQKRLVTFIKENRTRFYREWYKRWGNRTYYLGHSKEERRLLYHFDNPELGCECQMILKSLKALDCPELGSPEDILFLHNKYIRRFSQNYLCPKVLANGGFFPHQDKLKAIQELIARGFKHEEDVLINRKKHWVKCHIAPLVWPEQFETQQQALDILTRYGIPGYTGTVLAKE